MQKNLGPTGYKSKLLRTLSGAALGFRPLAAGLGVAAIAAAVPHTARAFNLYNGENYGNNLEINLTTTLSYTGDYRVNDPSQVILNDSNADDGDRNFRHGVTSNLFEAVPILDIQDGEFGAHFSSELFLNTPYLSTNQNNSPETVNPFTIGKNTDFARPTIASNGRNAELLDAFAYGTVHFGANQDQSVSLKVGRQTLLWGQSLFFPTNGIAGGMAPNDAIVAQNLANPQTQQVVLPVGQAVLTYSPNSNVTLQGYYQFEWRPTNLEGVGSYFSSADLIGPGGQRLIAENVPGIGNFYFFRAKDLKPPTENGQFGLSVQSTIAGYDLGLYGLRYDQKTPEVYEATDLSNILPQIAHPPANGISIGNYQIVYPRDIWIVGSSVSTNIFGNSGPNVAGEIAGHFNQPLVGGGLIENNIGEFNANSNPLYPVGTTLSAQASYIYVSGGVPFDPGGITYTGELAYNHVVAVNQNRANLAVGRQGSAAAFEVTFAPTYYDVLPNLEVQFPIGILYNVLGRSLVAANMNHGTGTFNFGITGTYSSKYIVALNYQDFLGKADPNLNASADRGYIQLSLQYSF